MPPVVVYGSTPYDPWYWHDYYYAQPWYWRMWHRPVYHAGSGWATSWVAILGIGIGLWVLLGIAASMISRRRRH